MVVTRLAALCGALLFSRVGALALRDTRWASAFASALSERRLCDESAAVAAAEGLIPFAPDAPDLVSPGAAGALVHALSSSEAHRVDRHDAVVRVVAAACRPAAVDAASLDRRVHVDKDLYTIVTKSILAPSAPKTRPLNRKVDVVVVDSHASDAARTSPPRFAFVEVTVRHLPSSEALRRAIDDKRTKYDDLPPDALVVLVVDACSGRVRPTGALDALARLLRRDDLGALEDDVKTAVLSRLAQPLRDAARKANKRRRASLPGKRLTRRARKLARDDDASMDAQGDVG